MPVLAICIVWDGKAATGSLPLNATCNTRGHPGFCVEGRWMTVPSAQAPNLARSGVQQTALWPPYADPPMVSLSSTSKMTAWTILVSSPLLDAAASAGLLSVIDSKLDMDVGKVQLNIYTHKSLYFLSYNCKIIDSRFASVFYSVRFLLRHLQENRAFSCAQSTQQKSVDDGLYFNSKYPPNWGGYPHDCRG